MVFIEGEGRHQATLFPVLLDLVPPDHICRVIDAFVARLAMSQLEFERAVIDAAVRALEIPNFYVAADAGYSSGKQGAEYEARGFELHIPAARAVHTSSGGAFIPEIISSTKPINSTILL